MSRIQRDELVDIRQAAGLVARHPETVRRWVWSGRLPARREGNRLMVTRRDLEALAGGRGRQVPSLGAWAERARATLGESTSTDRGRSAADLVIEDRERRAAADELRAGR